MQLFLVRLTLTLSCLCVWVCFKYFEHLKLGPCFEFVVFFRRPCTGKRCCSRSWEACSSWSTPLRRQRREAGRWAVWSLYTLSYTDHRHAHTHTLTHTHRHIHTPPIPPAHAPSPFPHHMCAHVHHHTHACTPHPTPLPTHITLA